MLVLLMKLVMLVIFISRPMLYRGHCLIWQFVGYLDLGGGLPSMSKGDVGRDGSCVRWVVLVGGGKCVSMRVMIMIGAKCFELSIVR